ncbi:rho-related GTP-binding protein RhoF isoform X1 [Vidua chalybeata]|uniref:rho-related GTP-binding protein RhoF isoform X1 n=1 Tax=Vidua chalybeata TaxID=81927 RepID=UPI0023A8D6E0|nr:rho-related GTP-binding protein RhoF isoform X1 [Vidua chalybeata]XP_053815940.1 rho-related GTP-binding protein RhoF isoform X1 [Vidua chalybeata]
MLLWYLSIEVKSISASWKWPKEATCRSKTAVPGGRIHEVLQLGEVLTRVPGAAYVQTRARNCWGSRRWTASLQCRPSELCESSALLEVVFQYAPSVFEKYTTSVTVGKKEVTLNLYDTAGQEDYDRLRPLSYQNTNVVLICYDVMNPTSYDNVAAKWYPEVNHFCRGVPLVLIGCKTDLRKDKEQLRKLRAAKQEPITYSQGEAACKEINAQIYLECSAKCRENIENVFKEATTIALSAMKKAKGHRKQKVCSVL